MRLIPAVRPFTFTVGAALAAVVVAPALKAQDTARQGTSVAHGAIMGVPPSSESAPEELPGALAWNQDSPFDREFRNLLDTLRKGSRQARGSRSLWRAIGGFLRPSGAPTGKLPEETAPDQEFGETALSLDMRLGLPHSAPSSGSQNYPAGNSTSRASEANLLADLERTAPAAEFPNGSDHSVAPIGANASSSDGGSLSLGTSGYPLAISTTPGANPGAVYMPQPPGWYVLPPSAPASGISHAGSFSGEWQAATGPLNPRAAPISSSFGPAPAAANWNYGALRQKFQGIAGIPTVPAPAPAASIFSQTVAPSPPVTASGNVLTSELMVAPAVAAAPGIQPAGSDPIVLSSLADAFGGTAIDYYNGQSFIAGPAASLLTTVTIVDSDSTYTPVNPELEIEVRNTSGTQGATLYTISGSSNWSFNSTSHQLTFTAPTSFTLSANTGYWLIASDPGTSNGETDWDYTTSTTYTSQSGFSIPTSDATMGNSLDFDNGGDGTGYYPLSIGPYLFSLGISAVPEPGAAPLLLLGSAAMLLLRHRRSNPAV